MSAESPIPPVVDSWWKWSRTSASRDAIVNLNKLYALEIAFGGKRFPVQYAGENAIIDLKQTIVASTDALPAMAAYTVLGNPTGALATPVATGSPILTSVIFGASGGSITGTTGSVDLAASGASKKITLTTGTGGNCEVVTPQATFIVRNTSSTHVSSVRMFNDLNSAIRSFELGYTGSSYSGSPFSTGGITGESAYLMSSGAFPLQFGSNNVYCGAIVAAGRWLIGTTTDDGATLFQVAGAVKTTQITWSGAIKDTTGTGSPEGVVAADVGSVFRRTNGGTGTTLYIKESGSGNTGWVPVTAGSGSPGGSNTQLQYNNSSSFGGISGATSDGTNVTFGSANLRATFPRITTGILDANGAEAIRFTATASAANDITVTNAASGSSPTLSASGDDANVSLNFEPKGTGTIIFNQTASGGLTINQTSSNQPYIIFQVSASNKALIGAENGAGSIITGSSNGDLAIRGIAAGISFSSDNGASVAGRFVTTTGQFLLPKGIASTSTTTGTLVVTGGVGVSGALSLGGTATIDGDIAFTPTLGVIRSNTSDTSDTKRIVITGGGAADSDRGSYIVVAGNEFTGQGGNVLIQTGSAAGSKIIATGSIQFNSYGAGTLTTDSSGNITAVSDSRAKNTVSEFTLGLTALRQLQPKKYRWKPETGLNQEDINVSLYAQDLIAAGITDAVFSDRTVSVMEDVFDQDGTRIKREKRDELGRIITQRVPADYYTVSDRAVICVLVNAIKELADRFDAIPPAPVSARARA